MTEAPRYRITAAWLAVNGIPTPKGKEFESNGWPQNGGAGVEPVNETARRVLAHQRAHNSLPASPYDSEYGRTLLMAAQGFDASAPRLVAVAPDDELPNMPAYRVVAVPMSGLGGGSRWSGREVRKDDTICYLHWPFPGTLLEPANKIAKQVADYLAANATHPKILGAPWDFFSRSVFLPELPRNTRMLREAPDQFEQHREMVRGVSRIADAYRRGIQAA
jgi:hypothetical protein